MTREHIWETHSSSTRYIDHTGDERIKRKRARGTVSLAEALAFPGRENMGGRPQGSQMARPVRGGLSGLITNGVHTVEQVQLLLQERGGGVCGRMGGCENNSDNFACA
jgi:hypothetical protein